MSVILATAGYDKKIRFWEAPSGICSRTLRYTDSQVNCLEISPDKQLLAAGGNPHIRLYDIPSSQNGMNTNNAGNAERNNGGNGGNSANSNANAGADTNASNNNANNNNNNTNNNNSNAPQNPNNTDSTTPILQCEGHTSSVTSIGFQRDGHWMYSSSEDHTVKLWDLRSNTYSHSFDCQSPVNSVALHPNQSQLVCGDQNGVVMVWDLKCSRSKEPLNELIPDSYLSTTRENGNGRRYGGGIGGMGTIGPSPTLGSLGATSTTAAPNHTHDNHDQNSRRRNLPSQRRSAIQAVDISEDGRLAMAASNHATVYLWDPSDMTQWKPLHKFRAHPYGAYLLQARISPDGRHLVTTSSDQTAKLWDIPPPSPPQISSSSSSSSSPSSPEGGGVGVSSSSMRGVPKVSQILGHHKRWVWDAVFSADSSYLVTACSDYWARLWNLQTGEVVREYIGHRSTVTCVALNDSST